MTDQNVHTMTIDAGEIGLTSGRRACFVQFKNGNKVKAFVEIAVEAITGDVKGRSTVEITARVVEGEFPE